MSSLMLVKLRRDLRASWSRFVLMVVAIAVSLTVFGGVLFAWAATGRETSNAYTSTEPASATILLERPIDAQQMTEIAAEARKRPGVIEATGRTQFDSDIQVNGQSRDIPLQVFVATPDEPVRLRVAGLVYDPSLSPAFQEQRGHGYLSTASLPGGQAPLDQLKIQVADQGQATPSRDRDRVVAVAGDVGEWLQREYGLAIREIQVPEPYAHPHQWQADALL